MKCTLSIFIALLLVLQSAHALDISDYSIVFDISSDGSVFEEIDMTFSEELTSSTLNYVVLGDVSNLRVSNGNGNIDYIIEKTGTEHNVKFTVPEGTDHLKISFNANDLVFANENVYSFSTSLSPPDSQKTTIFAYLPEGFSIYRDFIHPGDGNTLTDGERIYIEWDITGKEDVTLSFKFYSIHNDNSILMLVGFVILFGVVFAFVTTHLRRKVESEFMRGFSEDERKVLTILSQKKICMQKKLEKEFGFSRAKMTRIVKSLECKGLVEKEKIGRTNRLFYKK